jgi:aminoglycoside phosphotransferase family enzyme
MKEGEVRKLALCGLFKNRRLGGHVDETHISWVILTRKNAFKIKKPLKLSFLDFSTLAKRRRVCEKEVQLNKRFTDIYLSVMPVRLLGGQWFIGGNNGKLVDYVVAMKRMMLTKRMDKQLRSGRVSGDRVTALALEVASFHINSRKVYIPFELSRARNTFNDIGHIRSFVARLIGSRWAEMISRSIKWSDRFLKEHEDRIQERIDQGFKRDVHGDLHSGNIFLYRKPVLFDCIEFNDTYRQIDVLYEIAFICMDMEAFQQTHLAKHFLSEYKKRFRCFETMEDKILFIYFKCLRANVRAKVHAMSADQAETTDELAFHINETKKYLLLMKGYMANLKHL